jgi:dTDP-glucose 4,6-dehydratase
MKRYLITGGCGFIGSNFINYIMNKESHSFVVNVDKLDYCADVNNVHFNDDPSRYIFIHHTICDKYKMCNIMNEFEITHVVHFAAQSHVDGSFDRALDYTMDNIYGTHCLLEAARVYNKLALFLHFSTDEVYGESLDDDDKFNEMSMLCPTNPYSATKAGAEMLVNSYIFSFKLPCIITRGNNVYGPNQYHEKLIPRFIKLLDDDNKLTIHGDGDSKRSFIHVDDVCSAVDTVIHKGKLGEIYNIGSDDENEMSVLEVAEMICTHYKNGLYKNDWKNKIEFVNNRPFNDKRYFITNLKLKGLGWACTRKLLDYIQNINVRSGI